MSWRGSPCRIRSAAGAEGSLSRLERKSTMGRFIGAPRPKSEYGARRGGTSGGTDVMVRAAPPRSITGQRLRRLETYFDAAFEGLVIGLGIAAREPFAHGLDDHAVTRHSRFFQLRRHAVGTLLR